MSRLQTVSNDSLFYFHAKPELLRDILNYHEKISELPGLKKENPARFEKLKNEISEIAKRLIDSHFAAPSKSKAEKELGIVTKARPVVAKAFEISLLHKMENRFCDEWKN